MKQLAIALFVCSFILTACSQSNKSMAEPDYIVNTKNTGIKSISEYIEGKGYEKYAVATFAGGCFWCTEAALDRIEGVVDVISGYSGGVTQRPTYEQTGTGRTGHTESIMVYYDPNIVSYDLLLAVLFVAHDPTQLNRQGNDVGTEYRSAIFYHNEEQKTAIENAITMLNKTGDLGKPIVTEVAAYDEFWVAEEYHQNYYELHPENSYVQHVSRPKVEKVMKVFKDRLKPKFRR